MKKHLFNTLATLTALSTAFYPVLSYTRTLDPQFACKSNAHTFIAGLINDGSIDRNPTHVEANSVNAFRPEQGSDLTAFGFHVHAVFGYEHNDAVFKQGGGEALAGSLYGAVVSAPTEEVEARARKAGSDAVVQEVLPLVLTAIVCNKP
ncbi:hypothetical protein [Caballeronia sp.]|jgi:hypothetical protein|uniref:hypothetical protein n=1 Tax=Caballeronia sp. TaxID=1931223 RepID=UPI003C4FFC0A